MITLSCDSKLRIINKWSVWDGFNIRVLRIMVALSYKYIHHIRRKKKVIITSDSIKKHSFSLLTCDAYKYVCVFCVVVVVVLLLLFCFWLCSSLKMSCT